MTVWSCIECTYLHDSPQEQEYLACAMCAYPKPNAAAAVNPNTNYKRQGNLWQHFSENPSKRQCTAVAPSKKKSASVSSTNNVVGGAATSSLTPKNHRSICDALKPRPASFFVPRARYRDNAKDSWREVERDQDLSKLCPVSIVRDVLPSQTAARLLEQLEQDSTSWNRGNWIVHGKEHLIPRTTATFHFDKDDDNTAAALVAGDDDENKNDEYRDHQKRSISPELNEAANIVAQVVKEHCPWADSDWTPTFALANRYENGQDCVGFHSDHIMKLGPRPIIVGLSLGACRRFELKQQQQQQQQQQFNNVNHAGNKDITKSCRHVSVPLPHNSLCIMWNDAQESWQHSVPRCSDESITQHPKVGLVRISLTFRRQRRIPDLGTCFCGRPAGLKAKDGKYYLFCVPYGKDKRKTCNLWKPCRWAEEEAVRLAQLERMQNNSKRRENSSE